MKLLVSLIGKENQMRINFTFLTQTAQSCGSSADGADSCEVRVSYARRHGNAGGKLFKPSADFIHFLISELSPDSVLPVQ
jgi:hypothetical protein